MFSINTFRKWLQRKSRPVVKDSGKSKRRPSFRLQPEALEDRLAPANAVWTGAMSNLWSVGGNWNGGTGPGGTPGANDVAVFNTTGGGTNASSTIDTSFVIQGIQILNYTGTITNTASLTLTANTGYVQSDAASTFTNTGASIADASNWASSAGTFTDTSGTVSFTAGAGTQTLNSGGQHFNNLTHSGPGTLRLSTNGLTVNATLDTGTSTFDLQGLNATVGSLAGTGTITNGSTTSDATLTVANASANAFSGNLQDGATKKLGLTLNASAAATTFTLSGADSDTLGTTVTQGTLIVNGVSAFPSGTALSVAANGTFDLDGNSTQVSALSSSGTITNGSTTSDATLTVANSSANVFSGVLKDGASKKLGLTLNANAATTTLTLSGNNTYSGATTLDNGDLVDGSATGLSSTSTVKFLHTTSTTNFPTLDVTGFSVSAAALLSLNASGALQFTAGTESLLLGSQTLTVGSNNNSSLFSGAVNGTSSSILDKQGTGTFYLFNGNNVTTFLGSITIDAGYVIAGVDGSLGSTGGIISVHAGGSLTFAKGLTYNTAEPVVLLGNGVMVGGGSGYNSGALQGNNATFAGSVHLQQSSLMQASGNSTPTPFLKLTGAVTLNGGTTLTIGGHYNDAVILAGSVAGGNGIVTLGATGFTPHVAIGGDWSVPVTVASGTTLTADGVPTTPGAVNVASGGTLYGTGTVGALTVIGTVQPGDPNNSFTSVGIGTLTAASADFSAGGTLKVLIQGKSGAKQFDVLNLGTGTLTLGGTSTLVGDLNGLSSSGNLSTVTYTIVTSGGVTGDFNTKTFLNQGSHTPSESVSGNNVIVTAQGVGDAWAPGSSTAAAAPSAPTTDGGQPVTVAVLDTGLDFSNPAAVPNIWINQAEIPAAVLPNLVDVYHDGFISFRDLQDPINQAPGKTEDVYHDGYISVRDLLAPLAEGGWATGQVDPADGLVDDIVGWNFVDNNNNPYDYSGHGTFSANQVTRIDPNAVIMPLQMLDRTGIGSITDATAALNYAVSHGARIALDAWVPYVMTGDWLNAVAAAGAQGTLIITAAGNDNALALDNLAQAHLSNVVIVGAVDQSNRWASFSNSGAGVVDLAAPGVDVVGLVTGGQYQAHNGTSVSAAQVAGGAALAWGLHPLLTDGAVVNALYAGADRIVGLAGDVDEGRVLNIAATLAAAAQLDQMGVPAAGTAPQVVGSVAVTATALSGSSVALVVPAHTLTPEADFVAPQYPWAVAAPLDLQPTPSSSTTLMPSSDHASETVNTDTTWSPVVDQGSHWLPFFVGSEPASGSSNWDTLTSLTATIEPENE
jgi:autotransporter-associated beta strand protein